MSGETDLLRQYVDRRISEMDLRLEQRFQAQQQALVTIPPVAEQVSKLEVEVNSLDRLMEAKFVTFQVLVESNSEKVALALTASEKAISKAEDATEKRFDAVNEFRGQLADQATTFVRVDFLQQALESRDALIAAATERIRELELSQRGVTSIQLGGKEKLSDQRAFIASAVGVMAVVISLVVIIVNIVTSKP